MASRDEIAAKNALYDHADGPVWRLAVYEPVHDGRAFANMGGATVLDAFGEFAQLTERSRAVEFCSGLGEGCRYLADKFGCHVTGIELNPYQIGAARRQRACLNDSLAVKLHFVHDDILSWRATQAFDLVYDLDSFALIPDTPSVLKAAYQALRPGGRIAFAEIVAGERLTDDIRRFVWDADGMVSIHAEGTYQSILAAVGFTDIVCRDRTALASDCFARIEGALSTNGAKIAAEAGLAPYESWSRIATLYKRWFDTRLLEYTQFTAVK